MTNPEGDHPGDADHRSLAGCRLPADLRAHAEQVLAGTDLTAEQAVQIAASLDVPAQTSAMVEALRAGWRAAAPAGLQRDTLPFDPARAENGADRR